MQGDNFDNLISPSAADRLIAAHDGDLALLFIFMQRSGSRDLERAAGELCRTLAQMQEAYEKLIRMGLVNEGESCSIAEHRNPAPKLLPADEVPEYTTADIVSRTLGDSGFTALLHEAERLLGKKLSTPELRKLFGIYDYYALPAEVAMVLLHYCVSTSNNRLPTMRYIENEARNWANREILTLEQAEEYIAAERGRREAEGLVAETLNIRGRKLSTTEAKYIHAWIDMGFDNEVIALAYDRTVTNTGSLKWSYMNKILSNWKEKGLYTVAEIEEKDNRRPVAAKVGTDKPMDMDALKAMLDKI